MNITRTIFCLFSMAAAAGAFATDAIELRMRDGSLRYVSLADAPKLYITDTDVKVDHLGGTLEFGRKDVLSYAVGDFDLSGVESVEADFSVKTAGLTLTLSGLRPGAATRLTSIDGRVADSRTVSQAGSAVLSASTPGVYIVETESSAFKVILK